MPPSVTPTLSLSCAPGLSLAETAFSDWITGATVSGCGVGWGVGCGLGCGFGIGVGVGVAVGSGVGSAGGGGGSVITALSGVNTSFASGLLFGPLESALMRTRRRWPLSAALTT